MSWKDRFLAAPESTAAEPETLQAKTISWKDRLLSAAGTAPTLAPSVAQPISTAVSPSPLSDPQRQATALERVLDALAIGVHLPAGMASQVLKGEPIRPREALAKRATYGTLAREIFPGGVPIAGMGGATLPAGLVGLAADIALDPLTYTGVGVTTKGAKALQAARNLRFAELSGDPLRIAGSLRSTPALGATAVERARLGQEALLTFAGHPALPRAVSEAGVKVLAPLGKAVRAATSPARIAPELEGVEREAFMQRLAQVRAARGIGEQKAVKALRVPALEISRIARAHGLDDTEVRRVLADAVEYATPELGTATRAGYGYRLSPEAAVAKSVDAALAVFPGPAAAELGPATRNMVARINALNASNLARTLEAGIPLTPLPDDINYLRHLTRREAREFIEKHGPPQFKGFAREITEQHGPMLRRALRDPETGVPLTLNQANRLAETGQLSITGYKPLKGGLFESDPMVATVIRSGEASRAIEATAMLKDWARVYGKSAAQAPRGWHEVPSELPALQGIRFDPETAKLLTKHFETVKDPARFFDLWRQAQRTWVKYTLGIFPVYHTRNELGDLWNAAVLGGMNMGRLPVAVRSLAWQADPRGRILRGARSLAGGGAEPTVILGGKTYRASQLIDMADKAGATQSGRMIDQVRDALGALAPQAETRLGRLRQAVDNNAALRAAYAVGNFRENTTRLALFMDRLAKGDAPESAGRYVSKYLFDYGELTDAEKFLRLPFPFLAWTRKNVPLQLEHLFRRPGAAAGVQKLREEAAGGEPLGLEGVPLQEWMAQSLPVRAGRTQEGLPQFLRLEGTLPLADLRTLTPAGAWQRILSLLSPGISMPLAVLTNYDIFRQRPLDPLFPAGLQGPATLGPSILAGSRATLGGVPGFPARLRPIPETARALTEIERLFGTRASEFEQPGPGLRAASFLLGRPYAVDPELQERRVGRDIDTRLRFLDRQRDLYLSRGDLGNAERAERLMDALMATRP